MDNATTGTIVGLRFVGSKGTVVKPEVALALTTEEKEVLVKMLRVKLGLE